jgi:hypothetical protein
MTDIVDAEKAAVDAEIIANVETDETNETNETNEPNEKAEAAVAAHSIHDEKVKSAAASFVSALEPPPNPEKGRVMLEKLVQSANAAQNGIILSAISEAVQDIRKGDGQLQAKLIEIMNAVLMVKNANGGIVNSLTEQSAEIAELKEQIKELKLKVVSIAPSHVKYNDTGPKQNMFYRDNEPGIDYD